MTSLVLAHAGLRRRAALGGLAALLTMRRARAQQPAFPTRPVRIISGYSPGGPTDVFARILAERLTPIWGQPVIVENRPGAGGNIGAEYVARAPADGHVLLFASSAHVQTPPLQPHLPFDPLNDFTPVMQVGYYPLVLCVLPAFPARTLAEFLAYAKARPGEVTMASSGIGNTPHLAAALLGLEAGIEFTHVQYSGTSTAQTALLSGEVKGMFQNPVLATQAVLSGRLRALATTGATRWRELPDIPTVAESGFAGFEAGSWFGVMGPARMDAALTTKIYEGLRTVLQMPAVRARLIEGGFDLLDQSPQAFRTIVERDLTKWSNVIRTAGIRAE